MKKSVLFYFFILLLSLISLEILARIGKNEVDLMALTGKKQIVNPNMQGAWSVNDAFCAFRGRAGLQWRHLGEVKTINREGFISSPDIGLSKPENTVRIVFLGESSTAGTGATLSDNNTWPTIVAGILKQQLPGKNIEFINAALGGYSSFESYGRLWARVRFFNPDIIVVYHGWNEMYYFNKDSMDNIHNFKVNQPDGGWDVIGKSFSAQIIKPHPVDSFIKHSRFLSVLRYAFGKKNSEVMPEKSFLTDDFDHRGIEIWRDNLKLIKNAASLMGAKLFVCKQATLITSNMPSKDLNRCRFDFHGFSYPAHLQAFNEIYTVIDEEIEKENIIDVSVISGKSEYFFDHVHPTKLGSKAIAEIVAKRLVKGLK